MKSVWAQCQSFIIHGVLGVLRNTMEFTPKYLFPFDPAPGDLGPNEKIDEGDFGIFGDGLSPFTNES